MSVERDIDAFAPFGPEADRHAAEHDEHPEPPTLALIAKCPECYREGLDA